MGILGEDTPPRELVIDAKPAPGDSSDSGGTAMAPAALTVIAGGVLAKYVSVTAGLLGVGVGIGVWVLHRKPREGRFLLRMDDGVLEVTRERRREAAPRIALTDLLDVTLDRQTRPPSGRGGGSERVRLAFERRAPDAPIFAPEEHLTPLEAQEWHSKVRVFLRKHGWVPEDER